MGVKNKPCDASSDRSHHWATIDQVYGRDKLGNILTKQVTICRNCGGKP